MPVSHSHQFLCVCLRPPTIVVSCAGRAGSLTSQISCERLPIVRRRYVLLVSARGSVAPAHTRTIEAPPSSASPGAPGMWAR